MTQHRIPVGPVRALGRGDLAWGYAAQALNVGAGLVLLPLVLRYLPPEHVGLWFVFAALGAFAQLLEFGLVPTLSRNASYVHAGARTLRPQGLPADMDPEARVDPVLLARLARAARRIHGRVAALAALLLLVAGTGYVISLVPDPSERTMILFAWVCYAAAQTLILRYGWVTAMLQGRGDVTAANRVMIMTRGGALLLGAAGLLTGWGLPSLGLAALASTAAGRALAMAYYRQGSPAVPAAAMTDERAADDELLRTVWVNARRLGAVQLGTFLLQRAGVLVASSLLGLQAAAVYGTSMMVLSTLSAVAMVVCGLKLPAIAAMQARGDGAGVLSTYGAVLIGGWAVFGCGLALLLVLGPTLLELAGSRTGLLPLPLLVALGLVFLLELNHSIAATFLTTFNEVPFVTAALASGAAAFGLGIALAGPWGVAGLVAAQGMTQLAYNNWKWPLTVTRRLDVGPLRIVAAGASHLLRALRSR
jgi:O-antigen/teichoic acid export membrane protein